MTALKRIFLTLSALSLLPISGCGSTIFENYREVEDLELVRTVGIDSGGGEVTVTAGTALSSDGPARFYKSSGPTAASVINDMQRLPLGKEALFSHTAHFVFGEAAAVHGLSDHLDYIERSPDMRMDTYLFIARGSTARELMTGVTGDKSGVSEELSFLADNLPTLGSGYAFTCRDVASALSQSGVALIQAVSAKKQEPLFDGQAERALVPDGIAVIKEGKLLTFLNKEQTFGTVLLLDKVKSRTLTVPIEGGSATVLISGIRTDFEPELGEKGSLSSVKVTVSLDAGVVSVSGGANVSEEDIRNGAEAALEEYITSAVTAALDVSKKLNADFLTVLKELSLKAPKAMKKLAGSWQTLFTDLTFTPKVEVSLIRTYDIEDPLNTGGNEPEAIWKTATR